MKIKILDPKISKIPHAYKGDAGLDLYACIDKPLLMRSDFIYPIPSGIAVAIPEGYCGIIIPRSSAGIRGIHLANATGIIDSGYRGEIKLNIINIKRDPITIEPMTRIMQMIVTPVYDLSKIEIVTLLNETERGSSGFGSSDLKALIESGKSLVRSKDNENWFPVTEEPFAGDGYYYRAID